MKTIREYLEIGSKVAGVPGGKEYYDRLKDDVKKYLDTTWTIVADLALTGRSIDIFIDTQFQSPIEQLMYLGLLRVFFIDFLKHPNDCVLEVDRTLEEISKFLEERGYNRVYFPDDINYQLDFFLWLNEFIIGPEKKIRYAASCIIECDGHNFHEITKEQATKDKSKDRTLEERGLHVIRFTGSEITKDPEKCALQVKDYVNSKVDEIARMLSKAGPSSGGQKN